MDKGRIKNNTQKDQENNENAQSTPSSTDVDRLSITIYNGGRGMISV